MKYGAIIVITIIILSGCVSTVDRRVATSEESITARRTDEIDLLLLDYRFSTNPERLAAAFDDTRELLAKPMLNKEIDAALQGLLGMCELAAGNTEKVKQAIRTVEAISVREERLYILRAALIREDKKRIETLEDGYARCTSRARLSIELAELRYAAGDYTRASALYDEGFASLPEKYRMYFGKNRDAAFQFMQNPPDSNDAKVFFTKDALTVADALSATHAATPYLNNITTNKGLSADALLELCVKAGSIYPKGLGPSDPFLRKDAAFFILAIVAFLENNRTITTRYSFDFAKTGRASPVPDITVTDYYFDAVLVLVEREIIDLPDGINFFPERVVSGMELNEIIKKIKRRYNY